MMPDHTGIAKPYDTSVETPAIIGIAGGTAAGKTTIARRIVEEFDGTLLSMDDFYRDFHDLHEPDSVNFDHPSTIKWDEFTSCLAGLADGETVVVPEYSFEDYRSVGHKNVHAESPIVVEGLWTLKEWVEHEDDGMRVYQPYEHYDISAYVELRADERLARRILRDIEHRGRGAESTIQKWRDEVQPMHKEHVMLTSTRADVIVQGDDDEAWREIVTR